jgi:hypothetical protein
MAAFSGTNLPPIVRLGGSSDALHAINEGTASVQLPPRHVRYRYFPVTTIMLQMVELPTLESEKIQMLGERKGRARRAKRR